jgi:hypothetical protein
MSKLAKIFLAFFAVSLMTYAAYALEPERSTVRVIHATFTNEAGQTIDFKVPEGRGVIVKNREKNLAYRLVPRIVDEQRVVFRVMELNGRKGAANEVETFELALGDEPRPGVLVPFALGFTGISTRSTVQKPDRIPTKQTAVAGGSCCVQCGGWEVCCEPSAGWCCEISSSCGSSCSVCNAEI